MRTILLAVASLALAFALGLLTPLARAAEAVLSITDPLGDDHGDGSLQYPTSALYAPGVFDLAAFEVAKDGAELVLAATFKLPFRRPPEDQVVATDLKLRDVSNNGLYLQNVDIYVDIDGVPGSGYEQMVPGRVATISPDSAWELAVVLTPQPYAATSLLRQAELELSDAVRIPDDIVVRGRTVTARTPLPLASSDPGEWGYLVVVTAAAFRPALALGSDMLRASIAILNMPVLAGASPTALGTSVRSAFVPPILDLLHPTARAQESALGITERSVAPPELRAWRAAAASEKPTGTGSAQASPPEESVPASDKVAPDGAGKVLAAKEDLIVFSLPAGATVFVGAIGQVLGDSAGGEVIATIVVTKLMPDGIFTAQVAKGDAARIAPGQRVVFR
ncbi:MAG: hypothetical protein HYV63_34270 [Candidatus Schekmanbacteria bacterium]|nr:hypothetical protein [Candidatus Schekmanbacteria bacterium]